MHPDQSWWYAYDAHGNLVSVTDPTGRTSTTTYNELGWPLSEVAPAGNAPGGVPADHTTARAYNTAGEVVAVTDPLGAVTEYGLDPSGYLEWVRDPVPTGAPLEETQLTWNAAGELATVTRPDGTTTETEYWPDGSLKAQRDAATNATTYTYDSQGRLHAITDPAGRTTTLGYDPTGRVIARQEPGGDCAVATQVGCVTYTYTPAGHLKTIDYADPDTADVDPSDATSPTAVGLLYNVGQDTTNTVSVKPGPDGRIRLESLADAGIYIDVLGWHGTEPAPAGGMLYETAAAPARVMSTSPASGTCTPSPCARLAAWGTTTVQVTGVNGVPSDDVTAVAVVAHATNPAGTGWLTMWPTGSATPGAGQLAYDGRHASALTVVPVGPAGTIEIFSSKATDLLLDVVGWYGPATRGEGLVAHQRDAELITDTRSGLGTCNPAPCSRLAAGVTTTSQVAGKAGIPADADAVAVILHAINPANPGWLVAWQPGQPVPGTANLTYGGGSFISGTAAIPVDDHGNIALWSSTPVDIVVQTVGWYEQATRTWTYEYAGDGLRRSKTAPDGTTTTYTWDRASDLPLLLAETIDAPGTNDDRTIRYLHGPAGRTIADITETTAGESIRWYHHDQLGSTRALTDHTGTIIGTSAYTPFGELTHQTGATTPIGWAGEYRDTETGFIYLRARHYDPTTGQFLTRDPLEVVSGDPYGYAYNDPINTTDPSGMLPGLSDIGDFFTGGDCGDGFLGGAANLLGDIGGLAADLGDLAWEYKWDIALTAAMFVPGAGAAAWTYRAARIVRAAKATQGMAGGIRATRATSWLAGRMWTGVGSQSTAVGRISSTGLRQFRNPAFKPKLGITQSNFESRAVARGRWPNNFHVEIWP